MIQLWASEKHTTIPNPRAMTVTNSIQIQTEQRTFLLIMTADAFITNSTMFGPERFTTHALDAEGLPIESTFGSEIFDDLFHFSYHPSNDIDNTH